MRCTFIFTLWVLSGAARASNSTRVKARTGGHAPTHFYEFPGEQVCEPPPLKKTWDVHWDAVRWTANYACKQPWWISKPHNFTMKLAINIEADFTMDERWSITEIPYPPPEPWEWDEMYGPPKKGDGPVAYRPWNHHHLVEIKPADPQADPELTDFEMWEPIPGYTCEMILFDAWKKCYANKGRGGRLKVGFLSYGIRPWDAWNIWINQ